MKNQLEKEKLEEKLLKKLENLFKFLKENRKFNLRLQEQFLLSVLSAGDSEKKVINLLYHVANTQSQPKIDPLAEFYRRVHVHIKDMQDFKSFVKFLTGNETPLFKDLYNGLRVQSGWGKKTAALFTKMVYQVHTSPGKNCWFWKNTPKKIADNDELWVPVDTVIIHIFKELGMKKPNFDKINKLIKKNYKGNDIEVWDDLWFWGFITQKVAGKIRQTEWNENKYWTLPHSDKDPSVIDRIKEKSDVFISLLV